MNLRREAVASSDYWEFQPGERVMTVDGYPGKVEVVQDGPIAGAENYVVTLDSGMGGGNYSASMLSKMPTSRSAAGIHLATDDYPELGTVIDDRPDPGKMTFTAALSQERMDADAEDHDEPGGDDQPHSCSYCGGTEFKDLTDNGRVRQATCAVCNGTMSAHPGMQWTPELIGDPSNHPKATVDPRSGASPGAGSPGQAGINDFIDFDSRVSTTASADDDTKTIPTRRVGFAGYVEGEKTNFANHHDNPDWDDEQAVGQHTGVHEFRGYSGRENDFAHWHDKGEITHVPLHGSTVYATQARVTKHGVDSYLKDPDRRSGSGRPNYPANDRPIFVKHGGSYFTLDGHHRTAAAMLRGDKSVEGHVYDADKHGFPKPEWSPFSKRLPRSLEKYSALAGAHLGCGFDTDDEADALQHELAYHDDGFCSARGHQRQASRKVATAFDFKHEERQTGGSKHPYEHTLTAHHPETGEAVGYANYYPPKRKHAPIGINGIDGDHPGAASALMHEIESRHPGSPTVFTNDRERDKNTPSHTNGEHGKPTDWDNWHPKLPGEIHRGFSLRVDPWHGRALNKPGSSTQEHLDALHHSLPEGPNVGLHWTANKDLAHRFAQNASNDPRENVPVVLHARTPEKKDIETRPKELFRHGVFPYDSKNDEAEVPVRRGRTVHVTGISWKPDVEHPDADEHGWLHHTYGEDEVKQHTAVVLREQQDPDAGLMLRTAARDTDFGFHVTASWADVQRKAKRIRAEGGVTIVIASSDGVGGQVKGDHGTYEALLVYRPGTKKVADWTCGCKWAAYAFERSPGFQRFEGRKCSHALALQFEAQSQGMFGKEVHSSEPVSREHTIVRYDPDMGEHVFARPYEGLLVGSMVARLRESDAEPAEIIGGLIRAGVQHRTAVLLWKQAEHEEGERRCPHCGGFIGVEAVEHHRCPHCGAPLGNEGHEHHHGAKDDRPPGPHVSGIALKAHDTGRVLMLQRGLDDPEDPAAGTWEFPGGHHEDGDLSSLHAGIREWQEEVGQEFPANGVVKHVWTSPNGVYQGHVVVIPSEKDLAMHGGRVVPNPDDPKGDCHEQAAWWDPEHARKIPNLRDEVKTHTPWKEIGKASLDTAKAASAWDPISNTNPQPGRGTSEPAHSNTTNPASTGWAAGEDPDNWNNLNADPGPLTPSLGFDAVLHDQPEPALPVAYGDEDATMRPAEFTHDDLDPVPDNPPAHLVPDSDANIHLLDGGQALPNSYHASTTSEPEGDRVAAIVAAFQKSAVGQSLIQESSGGDEEIAQAARAHLAKEAAKQFDFAEQQELISEGNDGRRARNLAQLRIKGTHYEMLDAALQADATDSTDLFI